MGALLDRMVGNLSPAALLTSTFFWAWFDTVPMGFVIFRDDVGADHVEVLALSLLVSVFALVAAVRSSKLRGAIIRPRFFALLSLLLGTVGTAAVFAGQTTLLLPLLVVSGLLIGLYQGVGIMVAGSVVVCQGTTNALVHIAVALPLSIVPTLIIAFLVPGASEVAGALLPLLSALSFATYQAHQGNRPVLAQVLIVSPASRRPKGGQTGSVRGSKCAVAASPAVQDKGWRRAKSVVKRAGEGRLAPALAMVFAATIGFGLVNTRFVEMSGQSAFDEYYGFIIRAVVSALIVVGYLRFSWQPRTVFNVAALLMAIGLIGGAVVAGPMPEWLFFAGYVCFDLLIWAIIIGLTYRSGRSLLATIGIVQGVDQFGIFAGIGLYELVPASHENVMWAALGVVVMLLVMMLLVRNQDAVASLDEADFEGYGHGYGPADDALSIDGTKAEGDESAAGPCEKGVVDALPSVSAATADIANDTDASSQDAGIGRRLDELAQRYFLSSREVDILRLLVSGRSGPYIAEELCISSNTVKTHIRHIYTKLDVHDRQELLDRALKPESDAVL